MTCRDVLFRLPLSLFADIFRTANHFFTRGDLLSAAQTEAIGGPHDLTCVGAMTGADKSWRDTSFVPL
jgi:hypothetical protein